MKDDQEKDQEEEQTGTKQQKRRKGSTRDTALKTTLINSRRIISDKRPAGGKRIDEIPWNKMD